MSCEATPAPQTPHPRSHAAAPRGIKFPISLEYTQPGEGWRIVVRRILKGSIQCELHEK